MEYKIGDIAQMLGISHEAVRFYEKQGLLKPRRDEKNGYRLYQAVDLNVLMRLRSYTSYGYTVSEAIALLKDDDLYDLSMDLQHKSEALRRKLDEDALLLLCMQLRNRHMRRVSGMLGECTIEHSPTFYGIIYRNNLDISVDITTRRRVREWMQMRPFAEALLIYKQGCWLDESTTYQQGLCMEELFAQAFGIKADEKVLHFPSVKSVYCVVEAPYEATSEKAEERRQIFDPAKAYIRQKGLRVIGDSFGRVLHTSMKSGEYIHYCEQWIPIE